MQHKTILQFSGGKDSLAVLLLLEKQVKSGEIAVVWANSGDAFPETIEQMKIVKEFCHTFIEVKGCQPESIMEFGYPVDVLPVSNHFWVQQVFSINRIKFQGYLECCTRSFLMPMHEFCVSYGATKIIRGQKKSDVIKGCTKDGDVLDGIIYEFPINDWSDDQVMEFIKDSPMLSTHYKTANTSMDCMHCTAYLNENKWKLKHLNKHYPSVGIEVKRRLSVIKTEIDKDLTALLEALNGN